MSDEPLRLAGGMTPAPAEAARVLSHQCEHAGCTKSGGWGFGRPKQQSHWFCYEHRDEGEFFL